MEDFGNDVFAAQNRARTDPQAFATELEDAGFDDAAAVIRDANQQAVQVLGYREGLRMAAEDHWRDQAAGGEIGHTGNDGSTAYDRMNRYGTWEITAGENISVWLFVLILHHFYLVWCTGCAYNHGEFD